MLIIRRSNCIYAAFGIATLKASEGSNITKIIEIQSIDYNTTDYILIT